MGSTKMKISVDDYPEHLNPFSEPKTEQFLTVSEIPSKRRVSVDSLRKNGTWSSKISKRVGRSVTWIEKSWLTKENSKKHENRIEQTQNRNKSHNRLIENEITKKPRPLSEFTPDSNEKQNYDYQEVRERIQETIVKSNEISSTTKCDEEKTEVRKRKKRPAPPPPLPKPKNTSDTCSTPTEKPCSDTLSLSVSNEKAETMENLPENASVTSNSSDSFQCHTSQVEDIEKNHSSREGLENPDIPKVDNCMLNASEDSTVLTNEVSEDEKNTSPVEAVNEKLLENTRNLERLEISQLQNENESSLIRGEEHVSINDGNCNKPDHEQITENCNPAITENVKLDENANKLPCCEENEKKTNLENLNGISCNGQAVQV